MNRKKALAFLLIFSLVVSMIAFSSSAQALDQNTVNYTMNLKRVEWWADGGVYRPEIEWRETAWGTAMVMDVGGSMKGWHLDFFADFDPSLIGKEITVTFVVDLEGVPSGNSVYLFNGFYGLQGYETAITTTITNITDPTEPFLRIEGYEYFTSRPYLISLSVDGHSIIAT